MGKLIILRGNSGSGKSSVAKGLQRRFGRNTLVILRRHETKANKFDFGEKEMRQWWNEKDYIGFIPERTINEEMSLDAVIEMILSDVQDGK